MKIGVVSEMTGSADICSPVKELASLASNAYLGAGEVVLFALSSPKEEYSFTNEGLTTVCGDSAMSSQRLVLRYTFQSDAIRNVRFESCGVTDRDCELKFHMGAKEFSIDIAKAEQQAAQLYYRVLVAIGRAQQENQRTWEFAKSALDIAVRSMATMPMSTAADGKPSLNEHANTVHGWYNETFAACNPRCYRAVIETNLPMQT